MSGTESDVAAGVDAGDEQAIDSFEAFNRAMGAGTVVDPYPILAVARTAGPIVDASADLADFGLDDDDEVQQSMGLFNAYSFDAVHEVLKDGTGFSSSGYSEVMGQVMGHSILEMDEPEHHTYRALVQQSFTRKAMERWEAEVVSPIVNGLIDQFVADGRADLVRQLLWPFPVDVISAMLGLPLADRPMFHRLAVELIAVGVDFDLAVRASGELKDYFAVQLAERRAADDPDAKDVISVLARAELDGVRLTDEEIYAFLRLLLPAGAETTYRSSSNLMCGLLTHPDQLDEVRADRSLVPLAIEEGLRWEPPLLTIVRTATTDLEIAGTTVPAGATVVTNLGAANHDAERWDDPERFDIHREPQPHIAFAHGPHSCLGMHLARMESQVVLEALLDRLPNLRLDPDAPEPAITGLTFRAPASLDVVWDT
jgi:cytochrome P450